MKYDKSSKSIGHFLSSFTSRFKREIKTKKLPFWCNFQSQATPNLPNTSASWLWWHAPHIVVPPQIELPTNDQWLPLTTENNRICKCRKIHGSPKMLAPNIFSKYTWIRKKSSFPSWLSLTHSDWCLDQVLLQVVETSTIDDIHQVPGNPFCVWLLGIPSFGLSNTQKSMHSHAMVALFRESEASTVSAPVSFTEIYL